MEFLEGIKWWVFLIPIIWFILLRVILIKRINDPNTYEEYLRKLTWITKKPVKYFFEVAADEYGLSKKKAQDDFNSYLKSFGKDELPHYVKRFLDGGKETLDEIKVYDYWKIF